MIADLKKLLESNGYYNETELGKILYNHCCPDITKKVLDFDKISNDFCDSLKIEWLKSSDTLLLDLENNQLLFFEIKKKSDKISCEDYVVQKLHEVSGKMVDSILVLISIALKYDIHKDFLKHILSPKKIKIKTFILCNVKSEMDLVKIAEAYEDERRKINHEKSSKINVFLGFHSCESFIETHGN